MGTISYKEAARTFDHTPLAGLPAYPVLRRALSDLSGQAGDHGITLAALLEAARDMTATTPYGDMCQQCQQVQWPHTVSHAAGWLDCTYRCPCGARWTCGYAADLTELI